MIVKGHQYLRYVDDIRILGNSKPLVQRGIIDFDLELKKYGLVAQVRPLRIKTCPKRGKIREKRAYGHGRERRDETGVHRDGESVEGERAPLVHGAGGEQLGQRGTTARRGSIRLGTSDHP